MSSGADYGFTKTSISAALQTFTSFDMINYTFICADSFITGIIAGFKVLVPKDTLTKNRSTRQSGGAQRKESNH
ncbi:hypothetical protein [Acetobacterium wieringae]|uniref:hypothetical protein n=1 Tax=Acetobacterium wieringae TaxID=52694 RepID=UPI0026E96822|nr:hypothetical protein [Acetobacterium wieringae]